MVLSFGRLLRFGAARGCGPSLGAFFPYALVKGEQSIDDPGRDPGPERERGQDKHR